MCVTLLCFAVPLPHRVDGFRQLGTASLVYATRVDPDPVSTTVLSKCAARDDLLVAWATTIAPVFVIVERNLVVTPPMGQNGIWRRFEEVFELQSACVEQSHLEGYKVDSTGDESKYSKAE
jgi:hypothetical protein